MPKFNLLTWISYEINKFSFYTKSNDDRSTMSNSGVMSEAEFIYFFSSKDKNPIIASRAYFRVIKEI